MEGLAFTLLCYMLCLSQADNKFSDVVIFVTDRQDLFGRIDYVNMSAHKIEMLDTYKLLKPTAIDYDDLTDRIFWSDVITKEIRSSRLDASEESTFLHLPTDSMVEGIAIDSQNRLLFYTDKDRDLVASVSLEDPNNETAIVTVGVDLARAIVVHPERKKVIWTDWTGWARIMISEYDGSNKKFLVKDNIHWPFGVTVDRQSDTVYWCDAGNRSIQAIQLDGSNRRYLRRDLLDSGLYSIFFFENKLYFTDTETKYVRAIDLNSNKCDDVITSELTEPMGIHVMRVSRCPDGWYGEDCSQECHCAGINQCHKTTGRCFKGCQDGFYNYCDNVSTCRSACECKESYSPCEAACQKWAAVNCPATLTTSAAAAAAVRDPDDVSEQGYEFETLLVLGLAVGVLFILSVVLAISVAKYRRANNLLKTYDHLQSRRKSTATVVTTTNNDYAWIGDIPAEKRTPKEAQATSSYNTIDAKLALCRDEPQYVSVGSLFGDGKIK